MSKWDRVRVVCNSRVRKGFNLLDASSVDKGHDLEQSFQAQFTEDFEFNKHFKHESNHPLC